MNQLLNAKSESFLSVGLINSDIKIPFIEGLAVCDKIEALKKARVGETFPIGIN